MTLRLYLALMSLGTLLCWIAWIFIIVNISPGEMGFLGLFFFYFSLLLAFVGTFSIIGFVIRKIFVKESDVVFRHVRQTFRQSVFISTLLILMLMLLSKNLLYWWNAIILLFFLIFVEAIIFSNRKHSNG